MRGLLLVLLLSLSCASFATESDAPGRVARLSLIEGQVSLAPAGTEEWAEAILNRPLTSGDRLFVENSGRAELQVGSSKIHVDQGTGLSIIELDDDVMRLELSEGTAVVRVLRRRDNETIEVVTPNATVELLHPGEYRIDANPTGDRTVVAARSGGANVISEGKSWRVDDGEEGTFAGASQLSANINSLGARNAFEDWANDRNRVSEAPVSARYVSNEVVGYEDLDRHGHWVSEPTYGHVWYPTYVAAGWAPYRYGRWVWVSPWGWSWVDNSPWGFAPFHYGRWAHVRNRWCWVPGPRYVRPVYAPALVAWAGSPGFSVAVGIGPSVGWFPLAPREVYVPGYRYSRRYLNNVNVSNTVIVNNTYITNVYNGRHRNFDYRYGRDPHAVTVVDRDRFRGGGNLDGHWRRVDQPDLRDVRHDPRPPALAPDRNSVFAARTLGRIPGGADHVVRRTFDQQPRDNAQANRPSRIPFDAEQRAIEANGGRPISRSQLRAATANNPAATGRQQVREDRQGGEGPREQQWRADRERNNIGDSNGNGQSDGMTGNDSRDRARELLETQRSRNAEVARDAWRTDPGRSSRPSSRESVNSQRVAPPVNSLQSQPGSPATTRPLDQPQQWRGSSSQERINRSEAQHRERSEERSQARPWSSSPRVERPSEQRIEQPRTEQRVEQPRYEQPRAQPQPRVERAQPQPRQEQPRQEQSNFGRSQQQERPGRSQSGGDNGNKNSGRSHSESRESSGSRPGSNRPQL